MPSTTKQDLEALIKMVTTTPNWEVKDHGPRWRITNSEGGGPLFVNKTPRRNDTIRGVMRDLAARGWDAEIAKEFAEDERQRRMADDRRKAEEAIRRAQLDAERQAREDVASRENLVEENAARLTALRGDAIDFGPARKIVRVIDGAFARELLRHNRFFTAGRSRTDPIGKTNRPFSRRTAEYFKDQMLRGEWRYSHQGMAVDIDGNLIDGQHRLVALMWADEEQPGITIETEITLDLPVENFRVVDAGKARTPTDTMALLGEANRLILAAAIKLFVVYDSKAFDNNRLIRLSNAQLEDVLAKNPGLREAAPHGHRVRASGLVASASTTGIYICSRAYRDAPMTDFLDGLATGFDLAPGDARAALRSTMSRIRASKKLKVDNVEQLAYFIKTWNFWLQQAHVSRITFGVAEEFPTPIERD